MEKKVSLSRCFSRCSERIVTLKSASKISSRKQAHLDKLRRDAEKHSELEKLATQEALVSKREHLCERLLNSFDQTRKEIELESDPIVSYSELGKNWIFETLPDGTRTLRELKGLEMKFTGEELLEACSKAIDAVLSETGETLNLTRIHQSFKEEILELPDDALARKIALSATLARYFNAQHSTQAGLAVERKNISMELRKSKLTLNAPAEKKSKIVSTTNKLDKKYEKQILSKFDTSKLTNEEKWKLGKLKTDYADIANLDPERIDDLTKKESV